MYYTYNEAHYPSQDAWQGKQMASVSASAAAFLRRERTKHHR